MNKRKRVIVIRYLGWLLMVALLSMVAIALFVKVKIWIIISSIITALLGCVFLFLRFCYRINGWFKSQYEKIYKAFWKRCRDVCEKWMVRAESKNSYKDEIELLSPKTHEKSRYVEILKSAVDNPNVKNIAISGPYGSGKSTIIASFENIFPKYKCLNLSLAAFAEECQGQQTEDKEQKSGVDEKENNEDQGQGSEDSALYPNSSPKGNHSQSENESSHVKSNTISMAELEYSLVQQFFYHVKASKIPESRFGRIHRWNKGHKLLWSIFAFLYSLIIVLCFCNNLYDKTPILSSIPNDGNWNKAYHIAFVVFSFLSLYCIIGLIHRIKGANVKVSDYELSFNKDEKISVFNRYLDELVYLFQTTGYEIVVLEDLDRFRNTSIFTKLRELNQLLNQSKDINRRIVFIYALRDDIFQDSKERTKFFDCIIPIIPYVNVSNSAAHFVECFRPYLGNRTTDLHKSFIFDIAPFVCDLRTIKAIAADFRTNINQLNDNLYKDNLLALILYKNLYPKNFDKVYEGSGPLKEIFNNRSLFLKRLKQKRETEIKEKTEEIKILEKEYLDSKGELNMIVVGALARCIPQESYLVNGSNNSVDFPSIEDDNEISEILAGHFKYIRMRTYQSHQITNSRILEMLPTGFDYKKRLDLIERKRNSQIRILKNQIDELRKTQNELEGLSFKEMVAEYSELLNEIVETPENNLLKFLVSRGYIDEQYQYYFTVFKEGILSSNDHEYVMAVKNIGILDEDQIGRVLDNPKSVLSYLVDKADYKSDMILNSMLVHEIIENTTDDKLDWILEKIKQGETICLDFINRYPYPDDGLIYCLSEQYHNLWVDFISDTLFSNESKWMLFENIIKYATVRDIISMNVDNELTTYLEGYGYPQEITIEKAKKIVDALKPQFKKLIDDNDENNFLDYSFQNGYYELNKDNISLIINKYSDLNLDQYKSAVYSAIVDSGIDLLSQRVESEIEYFAKYIVLSNGNTEEYETPFVILLNNESISIEIRQRLISHNRTEINAIEQVDELDLMNLLFEQGKVTPSWKNIKHYFVKNEIEEIDDRISIFINQNKEVIVGEIMDNTSPDNEDINLIKMILDCPTINDYLWRNILNFPQYDDCWANSPESLREEQVQLLIEKKRIKFDVETMKQILSAYDGGIRDVLFEQYHSEIINAIDEFEFSADELITFAEKEVFKDDKDVLYGQIQKDDIVNERIANKYLEFSISTGSTYPFDVFKQALCVSKDLSLKIKSTAEYFNRGFTPRDIDGFFEGLGEPFVKLNNTGQYVIFDNSEISPLLTSLKNRGFVGKEMPIKAGIKVKVKNRNKL